jgi:hypothetical protein
MALAGPARGGLVWSKRCSIACRPPCHPARAGGGDRPYEARAGLFCTPDVCPHRKRAGASSGLQPSCWGGSPEKEVRDVCWQYGGKSVFPIRFFDIYA